MERKLAAILAADVVGYAALMERDEKGTHERLKAGRKELFEPEITRHHGRVFKLMGDGMLAEFGSVVDAVECAVSLQRGLAERNANVSEDQQIQVRIGINLGEVIVEGDDRYGEGVNIAARLEQIADAGGICVSGKVAREVEKKLAFGFEPMGAQQVKNIAEPIQAFRVKLDGIPMHMHRKNWQLAPTQRPWFIAAAALVLGFGIAAGAWYGFLRQAPPPISTSGIPSLAVLPFTTMSGDPALEYFADGVTETLIAGLSRSPQIRVIARTSSDAYKGKAEDIRQIGRELGARYMLEGSVQKGNDKVRIVAQLIDAATGEHVWADRYDREGSDALALQDEVTEKIVSSLGGDAGLIKKKEYEQAWGKDRASLEEYDYYLRGHQLLYRLTKDDTLQAIAIWQEGLGKFPESPLLHIKLGWGYYQLIFGGWSNDIDGDYRRAFDYAQAGLSNRSIPPIAGAVGHSLMAFLQVEYKKDWDRGLHERDLTLALSPNDPMIVVTMSELAIRAGRPDDAIASLTRDIAWDPAYVFSEPLSHLGWAYFVKGEYQTALDYLKQDPHADPIWVWSFLAATYAELGRIVEARATVAKMREANPAVSLALLNQLLAHRDEAVQRRFIDALRTAGLPEN